MGKYCSINTNNGICICEVSRGVHPGSHIIFTEEDKVTVACQPDEIEEDGPPTRMVYQIDVKTALLRLAVAGYTIKRAIVLYKNCFSI